MTALPVDKVHIAQNSYHEAVRVTEAYVIQVHKRRAALRAIPADDASRRAEQQERIAEAVAQLEAAERAETAAWQCLDYERKVWLSGAGPVGG